MKTKKILLALALGCALVSEAQFPLPPTQLNLNTGTTNGNNTLRDSPGSLDSHWFASASLNSGYTPARIVNVVGTWHNTPATPPAITTAPYAAAWISLDHNCHGVAAADQSESWCIADTMNEYYKVTVNLTNPGAYALSFTGYADNCIYRIYLNGTTSSDVVYAAPFSTNYYTQYGFSTPITGVINTGWQLGANTLYIHVKSGNTYGTTNPPGTGNTGLLLYATGNYTPGATWPPKGSASCCLGNLCRDSQNPLVDDYEIPLNGHNFNFSSDVADQTGNRVNVGYNCGYTGLGKLNAFTAENTGSGGQSISVYGKNAFNALGKGIGVMGEAANSTNGALSVGVWGNANGATDNIGGNFFANGGGKDGGGGSTRWNIGVSGISLAGSGAAPYSYQVPYPSANIGVYGAGDPFNSRNGAPGSNWAAWFDGDVFINGTGYYTGFASIISDRKFKKEIKLIENASAIISKLKPSNYFLDKDNEFGMQFSDKKQFGFISQEVETILPDLVEDVHRPAIVDSKGSVVKKEVDYKTLNYMGFIALLTKGAQEQQALIANQQQQIDELKTLVQSLAGNTTNASGKTTSIPVNLSDKNMVVLNQNVPNPFAESTVISYNIPSDFTKAQVIFTSTEGKIIKTVDITVKGAGNLTVFANDLTHGVYTYSLVIDGKTIDTKKMIKE